MSFYLPSPKFPINIFLHLWLFWICYTERRSSFFGGSLGRLQLNSGHFIYSGCHIVTLAWFILPLRYSTSTQSLKLGLVEDLTCMWAIFRHSPVVDNCQRASVELEHRAHNNGFPAAASANECVLTMYSVIHAIYLSNSILKCSAFTSTLYSILIYLCSANWSLFFLIIYTYQLQVMLQQAFPCSAPFSSHSDSYFSTPCSIRPTATTRFSVLSQPN